MLNNLRCLVNIREVVFLITPNWFRDFAGAWLFYTILPQLPSVKPQFKRIARFAPLIGIIIGLIKVSIWVLLSKFNWPRNSLPFIIIAVEIIVTGGIHLDGLIDTADGIGAGEERQIEAMKDSRIGAIGVLSLIVILLIQIACMLKLGNNIIIALPTASFGSRLSTLWAIGHFPYIQKEGSGKIHKDNWQNGFKELIPSIIVIISSFIILTISPINSQLILLLYIGFLIGITPLFWLANTINIRFKGYNGDSYGALLVIIETTILFTLAIILPEV
ncbi:MULTISPECIES: adenosylcobinamide-GDP ribazoletransferase [Prochlorococcus]|uniref:adenosylcobinamide-GDP ribazoletransferase n=1 Tax=Prochlorococcus TaxID=1218 RepID=UPI000533B300|nr:MULTISPECIES: adenosylcobinamide-GDP ribazoletransferase [Prochlorococcus]KGG13093.1 Cobalamin synthase [Prochlorococcus sp. MIT 0601]